MCLNWGPVTTAQGASHTVWCWFPGWEEERVEEGFTKAQETCAGWEVKVILPTLSFRGA